MAVLSRSVRGAQELWDKLAFLKFSFLLMGDGGTESSGSLYLVIVMDSWSRVYCRPLWLSAHIHGEGDGTPLQFTCLENPMDRGAWLAAVHGVSKSQND